MRFEKYYFERFDEVPFDENNPRYVLSREGADEIIEKMTRNAPFTLSVTDFSNEKLVKQLLNIDVLKLQDGKLALEVPVFIESDLETLQAICSGTAHRICDVIIANRNKLRMITDRIQNGFPPEVNLYHLLCGQIFDGYMFDFLEMEKLVTTSKIHNSGLDYLVVMYEKSAGLAQYSNSLLCSYNRLATKYGVFSSFGDSAGNRKDLYRYLRLFELGQLNKEQVKFIDFDRERLAYEYNLLLDGNQIEKKYVDIFTYFGYVENGRVNVPVYEKEAENIVIELYETILGLIKYILTEALSEIQENRGLLAIRHGVAVHDIGNEIYHLIFGEVNEQLVRNGFVAEPVFRPGQGRFLQSYERKAVCSE